MLESNVRGQQTLLRTPRFIELKWQVMSALRADVAFAR